MSQDAPSVEYRSAGYPWRRRFPATEPILRGEGGSIHAASGFGWFWLISDESELADLLPAGDSLVDGLVKIERFPERETWLEAISNLRDRRPRAYESWQIGRSERALIDLVVLVAKGLDQTPSINELPSLLRRRLLKVLPAVSGWFAGAARAAVDAPLPSGGVGLGPFDVVFDLGEGGRMVLGVVTEGFDGEVTEARRLAARLAAAHRQGAASYLLAAARSSTVAAQASGIEVVSDGEHCAAHDHWRGAGSRTGGTQRFMTEHVVAAQFQPAGEVWQLCLAQIFALPESPNPAVNAANAATLGHAVECVGRRLTRLAGRPVAKGVHEVRELGPALRGCLIEAGYEQGAVRLNHTISMVDWTRERSQVDLVVLDGAAAKLAAELKVWDIGHQLFDLAKVCCLLRAGVHAGYLVCVARRDADFERLAGGELFPARRGEARDFHLPALIARHRDEWVRHLSGPGPRPTSVPACVRTRAVCDPVGIAAYPGHSARAVHVEILDASPVALGDGLPSL